MNPPRPTPWWLVPNLLALDAPPVAVVWQRALAAAHGIDVPAAASVVLGLTVWAIHLADRWLDSAPSRPPDPAERHRFARRHRRWFGSASSLSGLGAAVLAFGLLPDDYLRAGGWVALAVGGYLALVHLGGGSSDGGRKEALVGLLFAGGVAVPLLASLPDRASEWLPGVGAFAALCWLNCRLMTAGRVRARLASTCSRPPRRPWFCR